MYTGRFITKAHLILIVYELLMFKVDQLKPSRIKIEVLFEDHFKDCFKDYDDCEYTRTFEISVYRL